MYDLLIKGGMVVDPAQGIHDQADVGVADGKIAALESDIPTDLARELVDARGLIVTPGLIDYHVHVADGLIDLGLPPDRVGVLSGVTALCDGGSTGYATLSGFRKYVIERSRTDVFCLLNICSTGLAVLPEIWSWQNINAEATLRAIEENRDIIRGVKIRAIGSVRETVGAEAVRLAKRVAASARLPLGIHLSPSIDEKATDEEMTAFTREWLPVLDGGDTLFHAYTWREGGVIKPNGEVLAELREAVGRGVGLDPAHGMGMFSFEIARLGLEQGILPTTISSDATRLNLRVTRNLPMTMSKFLALGLSLDQVVEMATINPARALGEEQRRGSLAPGMNGDVSILEATKGEFILTDGDAGNTLTAGLLLIPKVTVKSGLKIVAQPFD